MLDELKKLLKHSSIYGFGSILCKAVGFVLIPVYTHYLTPIDYGVFELLDLTVTILGILVGMGIGSAILRFYYHYELQEDKYEVISTALITITLAVSITVTLCILGAKEISSLVFGSSQYSYFLQLVLISFFFSTIATIPESFLRAEQKSTIYTSITVGTLILNLSLNIYFVVVLKIGLVGILYASVIMRFLNTIVNLSVCLPKIKYRVSLAKLKEMLKFGVPLMPASFGIFILNFADRFILKHFSNLEAVGLYSLGYKFAFMISILIISPFGMIWQAQMFEISKKRNAKEIFSKFLTYFSLVVITAAFVLSIFIKDIISLIAPPSFHSAYNVVPIISLGYVFYGFYYFFQVGILLKKKTKFLGFTVLLSALSNIILNILLIPIFGAMGAAIATSLSFLFMSASTYIFSQRLYQINYEFKRILKILVVATFLFILLLFLDTGSLLANILLRILFVIGFYLILYIAKFFKHEEIKKIKDFSNSLIFKFRVLHLS